MLELDVLPYKDRLRIKTEDERRWIWDPLRKRWLVLQPEEFVRQLILAYLIHGKGFHPHRIRIEQELSFNELKWRYDLLVLSPDLQPWMLVECKAPDVRLDQRVVDQVARYNIQFKVPYLLITSGHSHFCWFVDHTRNTCDLLDELPPYPSGG